MKSPIPFLVLAIGFVCMGVAFAQDAQDNSQSGGGQDQHHGLLSSLSAEDKMKFIKARRQVLADNPDLKAEQEDLAKQRESLKSQGSNASQDDRKTLFQNMMAHEKKMQTAMLAVDPSLSPVFDQIDQQMKEKFHAHAGQNNES